MQPLNIKAQDGRKSVVKLRVLWGLLSTSWRSLAGTAGICMKKKAARDKMKNERVVEHAGSQQFNVAHRGDCRLL